MDMSKYFHIGNCTKAHGLRGALTFKSLGVVSSEEIKSFSQFLLVPKSSESTLKDKGEVFSLGSFNSGHKDMVSFKECKNRTLADEILPVKVYVKKSDLPFEEDEDLRYVDFVGMKVLDEKSGNHVGTVTGVESNGVQDLFEFEMLDTKEIVLLPYVDQFIHDINCEEKTITVTLPQMVEGEESKGPQ
jgi:16S rRNA processing protein RimM